MAIMGLSRGWLYLVQTRLPRLESITPFYTIPPLVEKIGL